MAAPPGAFSTFLRVLNEDAVEEEAEAAPAPKRAPAKKASTKSAAKRGADKSKK